MILEKVKSKYNQFGLKATIFSALRYPLIRIKWFFLLNKKTSEIFKTIHNENLWSSSESKSGRGSEMEYTVNLRNWLIQNIPKYKINTIVDCPCGDFNWMKNVLPHVSVNYLGFDIVDELIENNKKKYSGKNVNFFKLKMIEERIPNCDLLIIRDCLFHFSYKDINKFLTNIKRTEYKYLLITSHIVSENFKNKDIKTGSFRIINLLSHPFNFEAKNILDCVKDYPEDSPIPREMLLIKKEFVTTSLSL